MHLLFTLRQLFLACVFMTQVCLGYHPSYQCYPNPTRLLASKQLEARGIAMLNKDQLIDFQSCIPRTFKCAVAASIAAVVSMQQVPVVHAAAANPTSTSTSTTSLSTSFTPTKGYQTKSGLIYFNLNDDKDIDDKTGITISGTTPRYGQLISFNYVLYYRPTMESTLEKLDATNQPFLHKHGNGRIIRGLDEGLHTMKVGDRRRFIIPSSLAYREFGLGPLPIEASDRKRLGQVIDLIDAQKGQLVVDAELVMIANDENDQGYYEDEAISQDEVRELVAKTLKANRAEKGFLSNIDTKDKEINQKKESISID